MRQTPHPIVATLLAVAAWLPAPALAATWTVCPDGSCDYVTITGCAAAAGDGDTCDVTPAVYHEMVDYSGNPAVGVTVRCAGPRYACVVDGDGVRDFAFYPGSLWVVEGFEVRNTVDDAFALAGGRFLAAVRDCWIHDLGGRGVGAVGAGVVERNVIENTWGFGIVCPQADTVVRNNLVVNAGVTGALAITCGQPGDVVTHNTVDVRDIGPPYVGGASGILATQARHNVVLGGVVGVQTFDVSENNTVWGAQTPFAGTAPGAGDEEADPVFLGPDDYHLAHALDAVGSTQTVDLDGDARVAPPDRGAFEHDPSDVATPPVLAVDEVVASPALRAAPAFAWIPGAGPAVVWFEAGALKFGVRDGTDSWAVQDLDAADPPAGQPLNDMKALITLEIDPVSGHPGMAWVEDGGVFQELHFARYLGSSCGTGCTSVDWGGCDDPPLAETLKDGSVALAFDPVDGEPSIAFVAQSGVSCGFERDWEVQLFQHAAGGWTVQTLDQGDCTHTLGLGMDLSIDPVTGAAEVVYTRAPLGTSGGELWHARVPLAGPVQLSQLDAGGLDTWQELYTRLSMAHDDAGDLHVAYSTDLPELWTYAALHRTGGVWSPPESFDAIGGGTVRPMEGLEVVIDDSGAPVAGYARHGSVRIAPLNDPDGGIAHMDVRRATGLWTQIEPLSGGEVALAYQSTVAGFPIRLVATTDPGATVPGGGFGQACDSADPCFLPACDPVLGCVLTEQDCFDDNPCTADACLQQGGCDHPFVDGPCDDGDANTINDACLAGECVGEPIPVALVLTETLQIDDQPAVYPPVLVDRTEAVAVADLAAVTPSPVIRVVETVGVIDAAALTPSPVIALVERVGLSESVALFGPVSVAVTERVAVTDLPALLPSPVLFVLETVGVIDIPAVHPPASVAVVETIAVDDEVDVEVSGCAGGCRTSGGPGSASLILGLIAVLRRRPRGG